MLYRDNKDAFDVADQLERQGVPFSVESDQDILADADIQKLTQLLRCIADPNDEHLLRVLHIDFLGMDPLDVYAIIQHVNKERVPAFELIRDKRRLRKLQLMEEEKVDAFYRTQLSTWMSKAYNENLPNFFERVVRESGFLEHILSSADPVEKMEKLNGLFDEIQAFVERHREADLWDFLQYLDTLRSHNVLLKKTSRSRQGSRVRLMTAHRAKGQEFEYVYIIQAFEGHWGNRRMPTKLQLPSRAYSLSGQNLGEVDANEDERRLFYVALTRTKQTAKITFARENRERREQLPSQFIEEIKPELVEWVDVSEIEKTFAENTEVLYEEPKRTAVDISEKEFIQELFAERGISATALNNYLRCPWQYFYNNLLRIPKPKEPYQMFGTAVHAALKDFFDKLTTGETPRKELLLELFRHYLNQEPFTEQTLAEWQERGEESLAGYYDTYAGKWNTNVLTEVNIRGALLDDEVRLTGKLDKIEFTDSQANMVNVVDYKTGTPKSRNWIEGNTKNSEGDYKRQLVFYRLLLDRYKNGRYRMEQGVIDFIEPNDNGYYKQEAFAITDEETRELEELIRQTAEEIRELSFWNERCDKKDCEWCALRESME